MWGLETIWAMNRQAGDRARMLGLTPFHLRHADQLEFMPPFPFPNLGDDAVEVSKQYEHVEDLFCDKSGYGAEDEPALTTDQLKVRLIELLAENPDGIYLAIVEEGPFQIYVGVWR